jgi:hypothetical protein
VFVALNPGVLPARERPAAELYAWVRRDEEYATLGANVVVELNSESRGRKPTSRAWAIIRRADRHRRLAGQRTSRAERRQADRTSRPDRPHQPQERGWLPMPADPIHPDQLDGQARFRADLAAYLDSLSVGELAELLGELPSRRQQPLQLGVLIIALKERLPDGYKLLPPTGQPGPHEGRRRTLREVVADRGAARAAQHTVPPPSGLAEQHADRRRAGAVAKRRVAEALRTWATDPDPAADRQEPGDPPAEPADRERDRQGQERDREEDFGDSWQTYRERADRLRQTDGWTVPAPPPRAEHWLPLGRDNDQERTATARTADGSAARP